jgi:hypothetical protein
MSPVATAAIATVSLMFFFGLSDGLDEAVGSYVLVGFDAGVGVRGGRGDGSVDGPAEGEGDGATGGICETARPNIEMGQSNAVGNDQFLQEILRTL